VNLAACGGTFLTGLPRLTRFSYFLYIPSTSSGPEPVEGLNIPSILSKKWDLLYYQDVTIPGIIKSTTSSFRVGVLKGGGKAEYACVKKQFMHKYWHDGLV